MPPKSARGYSMLTNIRKRLALTLLKGVDVDFENKCEYCFDKQEWQTANGKFVCEKHMKMPIQKKQTGEK
jgi:hypothetical protein